MFRFLIYHSLTYIFFRDRLDHLRIIDPFDNLQLLSKKLQALDRHVLRRKLVHQSITISFESDNTLKRNPTIGGENSRANRQHYFFFFFFFTCST